MPTGHYRFRRSLGNVSSLFRGARPDTYPLSDPDVLLYEKGSDLSDYTLVGDTVTLSGGLFTVTASPAELTYAKQIVTTGETEDVLYSLFVKTDGAVEGGLTLLNESDAYKGGSFLFPGGVWRKGCDNAVNTSPPGLDEADGAFVMVKYSPSNGTADFGLISDDAGESRLSTYADTTEIEPLGGFRVGITGTFAGSATFDHVKMSKNWILCIGDSITAGRNGNFAEPAYDPAESLIVSNASVDIEYSYPEQLGNLRNGPSQALNLGDSADTIADINLKMSDYLSFMPSVDPTVVLFAGTNDINAGASLATLQTRWNTARASIEAAGGTMIGVEVLPRNSFTAPKNVILNDFNAWLATDADANGYSLVLVHDAFESAPDVMDTALAPDGTHPNIDGHKLIASIIVRYL